MLKKLVVLILATLLLGVAAPTFAATPAAAEPTTGELVLLAKTRAAGAQSGVTAAERADSLAQAATWARKDATAFQATASQDLATARTAAGAIPALPVASAATPATGGLNIEDLVKVLETISTTSFVDPTARAYATEVAKNALSRARGSAAEAAKWNEKAVALEQAAREAYTQAKNLLMPATPAPAAAAPAAVAPSATPATVTAPAPASPSAAEVQLRKELAAEKARANQLAGRVAELEKKAVATPAPTAAAPTSLRPAERAEDTPDAGTWPQNLPVAPAVVAAPTPATPAATAPAAPVAPAAVTPAVAPAATAPATVPAPADQVTPTTPAGQVQAPPAGQPAAGTTPPAGATTAPVVEYATRRDLDDVSGMAGRIGGRVSKVEDAVEGINDLRAEIVALRSEIIALRDAQAAEIAGLRTHLGNVQAEALRVQGETITTLRDNLEAFRRQLVLTWIIAGGLALLGLLLALGIGVRRWWVARRARRDEEARRATNRVAATDDTNPTAGGPRAVT